MKRKIIMLVGSLAALLVAFVVYRWITPQVSSFHLTGKAPTTPRPPQNGKHRAKPVPEIINFRFVERDEEGNLRTIFRAKKLVRTGRDTAKLTEPRVVLYQKDGKRIYLQAQKGDMTGEELARGFNFRSGLLSGDVRLVIDRAASTETRPISQRVGDLIRIYMNDVVFDNRRLTIRTDSPVTIFSPEVDLRGVGLRINWNTSPRELRLLRIEEGEEMIIKQVPDEFATVSLPGGEAPGSAAATKPVTTVAAVTTAPASGPAHTGKAATPTAATGAAPAIAARTTRPGEQEVPRVDPINVYRAKFHGSVHVDHGPRRVHGANVLAVTFEWSGGRKMEKRLTIKRRPEPPTTAPTTGKTPATTTSTAPAKATEPMIITWTGPLTIEPVKFIKNPSERRYRIEAEGDAVTLSDERTTATCRKFEFQNPQQQGVLIGTRKFPARLLLSGGEEVICEQMHFDRRSGRADLIGPGHLTRSVESSKTKPASKEPATQPAPADRIKWAKSMTAMFYEQKIVRADGRHETRPQIRDARFRGGVELTAGKSGDFVHCDDLYVEMLPSRHGGGKVYPGKATAKGGVVARQEGSDIKADQVDVVFEEPYDDSERTVGKIRAKTLVATGSVRVTDKQNPSQPVVAVADRISAELTKRTATLTGKPAKISQGPNSLAGETIELNERLESAVVIGRGSLRFLTKRDLNGAELDTPRPLEVTWSRGMGYSGDLDSVAFTGDVDLQSGTDRMQCGTMRVWFEKVSAVGAKSTTKPASPGGSRRLALNVEQYSRRRLAMIKARDDVKVNSYREDEQKRFMRLQMTGNNLVYDASAKKMLVSGAGTLVVEDYRLEKKKRPKTRPKDAPVADAIRRPWQTLFTWSKYMEMLQDQRKVFMDGNVVMVHRSGQQIVKAKALKLPPWPKTLPVGRSTRLTCEKLMAKFAPPDKKLERKPKAGELTGPRVGPPEMFSATRNVNLSDGVKQVRTVIAQRLYYYRKTDVAEIFGFMPNEPVANAMVSLEDKTAGTSQEVTSPKILWYRATNRIVAKKVAGGGSR